MIREAEKILPTEHLKVQFLEALAELEDNECHRKRHFPKTRLHKIKGTSLQIYRTDIDKMSGWRIHVQYKDDNLCLCDILSGQKHDQVHKSIKSKKGRYKK